MRECMELSIFIRKENVLHTTTLEQSIFLSFLIRVYNGVFGIGFRDRDTHYTLHTHTRSLNTHMHKIQLGNVLRL